METGYKGKTIGEKLAYIPSGATNLGNVLYQTSKNLITIPQEPKLVSNFY